ncbi:MAG: DNA-protecting protein DprA [Nocardioidaceae bacterium]|nr:MAG: DNA-protecting protein DprA [Nocardioidaceae bacterium]
MSERRQEHAALVALLRDLPKGKSWGVVTERVLECGSALEVWRRDHAEALIPDPHAVESLAAAGKDLQSWEDAGWQFLAILDADYPARLREIHQAPPFLFAAGDLRTDDPAIAVVGSRAVSDAGKRAATAAAELADRQITVLSGLAAGVDAAAHSAALEAGGRTVAIIGTGIAKSYPAANKSLQRDVIARGLVLSQFWPDAPPQPHHFLMRNAVMSGYGLATIVVEAGEKSGARAQARMAVEHGRPVVLTDHVVDRNDWAKRLLDRPGVYVASSLADIIALVDRVLARDTRVGDLIEELLGVGP